VGESKKGKIAVITRCAQGIGTGSGKSASPAYTPAPRIQTLKAAMAAGVEAIPRVGDISDEATVEKFAQAVQQKWGRVDVLVNNAGNSFIQNAEQIRAVDSGVCSK